MHGTLSTARRAGLTALLCLITLGACSGLNRTEQRTLTGGAIGAGVGTAAGALTGGSPATGALLGGAAGAGAGYLYDRLDR